MSNSSFSVNLQSLVDLAKRMDAHALTAKIQEIIKSKAVEALMAQAIADNFDKEGPGWKSLKPATIRSSLGKTARKNISKASKAEPARRILKRTGLLMKSVTTPGAQGNIHNVEGTKLIWGTNLVYAGIHNRGGTIHHPGSQNGFGRGVKIPAHDIGIPKREFLVLRPEWVERMTELQLSMLARSIAQMIKAGA